MDCELRRRIVWGGTFSIILIYLLYSEYLLGIMLNNTISASTSRILYSDIRIPYKPRLCWNSVTAGNLTHFALGHLASPWWNYGSFLPGNPCQFTQYLLLEGATTGLWTNENGLGICIDHIAPIRSVLLMYLVSIPVLPPSATFIRQRACYTAKRLLFPRKWTSDP